MSEKEILPDEVQPASTSEPASSAAASRESTSVEQTVPVENVAGDGGSTHGGSTVFEKAIDTAREQANMAADALRRGEFMSNAQVDPEANQDDRLIALLAYATQIFVPVVMPLIVLLSESSKKRPFQRHHAVQSLALTLTFFAFGLAAFIGATILTVIPIVGAIVWVMLACLSPIAYLMAVIALLYYGYQAYQGKRFAIPALTGFLHDQGWL